jgi:membrane-bound lytic murein transglycosylase MltF
MKIGQLILGSIFANGRHAECSLKTSCGIAMATGLLLILCVLSCSERSAEQPQASAAQKIATVQSERPATQKKTAAPPAASEDEDLPPVVKIPWKGDLDAIAKRRFLRVMVPFRRPEFFYLDGHPAGVLQEYFGEVEKVLNKQYKTTAANRIVIVLIPTPVGRIVERMTGGYADIVTMGISITEAHKALMDFTMPTMTGLKIIPVTGPGAPELKGVEDLSGKEVWVMPAGRMKKDVEDLNARLNSKGMAPARIREADPMLEPGDVMELVNAGVYPIALMQSKQAEFWAQVLENIKPRQDLALAEDVQVGWAIQKGTPQLKAFLDGFIKTHGLGTSFGNTVIRRYLKDAKYVRNAIETNELRKFKDTMPYFKKYSEQYNLNYLLMAAQGYQESRLDQTVKSPVGAVGIMQVMPSTAAGAPVKVSNIENVDNNILAGVRMMHFLIEDYFNEPGLDVINRMLFALAAYNAGPARIGRCRKMAKDMGYDPNQWFNNVEIAVAKVVGRETTQYVSNIYKYYVCYRLATDLHERRQDAGKRAVKK